MTDLIERLRAIRLLALDVDGVLTDGGIFMDPDGKVTRRFNIKDGLGIKLVSGSGIRVILVTVTRNEAIRHRAHDLGIHEVYLGSDNKEKVVEQVCQEMNIGWDQVAYMGDDLVDIPVLSRVGLPCAPADAVAAVKDAVVYVADAKGGQGAVRELCDLLVQVQNPSFMTNLSYLISGESQ